MTPITDKSAPDSPTDKDTERFEKDAARFYRETGMMAPGKDQPAAMGGHTYEERLAAWEKWCTDMIQFVKRYKPTGDVHDNE